MKIRSFSAGATLLVLCLGCSNPKSEATGCTIAGVPVADGTTNPENQCQVCKARTNPANWSNLPEGGACGTGTGGVCVNGNCTAGCQISGVFYAPGGASPDNACQTCQPKISVSSFSPATGPAPGGSCGNGSYCYQGGCSGGCSIAGGSYGPGDPNPSNPCQGCVPPVSATTWSNLDPGTPCGSGVCVGGACLLGCDIGGVLVAADALDPSDVCHICQPALDPSAWSPVTGVPSGGCNGGQVCLDGGCVTGCYIASAFYSAGERRTGDNTQCCGPSLSPSAWSPAFSSGSILVRSGYYPDTPNRFQIAPPVAADFNRDGRSDLALLLTDGTTGEPTVVVYLSIADAGFAGALLQALDFSSLASADLDGDGYPDLIGSDYDGGVNVLMNLRDGTFGGAIGYASNLIYYDAGPDDGGLPSVFYPQGGAPTLRVLDANQDGLPDVVVAGGDFEGLSLLIGTGDGRLQPGIPTTSGTFSTYAVTVTDIDGDGTPDLVAMGDTAFYYSPGVHTVTVFTYGRGYSLLLNDGHGGFAPPSPLVIDQFFPSDLTFGRFDSDDKADLAFASTPPDPPAIFVGIGDGGFEAPTAWASNESNSQLIVGDFNGDGRLDLIGPTASPFYWTLFLNRGDATFSGGAGISGLSDLWSGAAADFDGDHLDDLAIEDSRGVATIWINNCR